MRLSFVLAVVAALTASSMACNGTGGVCGADYDCCEGYECLAVSIVSRGSVFALSIRELVNRLHCLVEAIYCNVPKRSPAHDDIKSYNAI
ncbi:hypothetical protein EDB19DRAFT_341977 [Suillus lakei]|nr:hypothetical protein EDB19DRAFT_341977 [Suillus lakei]